MSIIQKSQIDKAKLAQTNAAHDASPQIRLVAGPGTGKSFSIGERVAWLINKGVEPKTIFAVSFTRAAAADLKNGIFKYCESIPTVSQIRVSTLHSLALTILAKGEQLTHYPTEPRVLDDWEQRNVFDEELKAESGYSIKRCSELRTYFEALWSTGSPPLPFILSPVPPISEPETLAFRSFHSRRSQLYSCLLPGESIRRCVDLMKTSVINVIDLLSMNHLIVDEYQDLNFCDVEFVDLLAKSGITVLVSGDDDQSIYSFRYAYPHGIQTFPSRHSNSGQHALQLCFRCTPSVLDAATRILVHNSPQTRISKTLQSAYDTSTPRVNGTVIGLNFSSAQKESAAIAEAVRVLIGKGIQPQEIMILVTSRHHQLEPLQSSMKAHGIMTDIQQEHGLSSSNSIRFLYCILRVLKSPDDYLAYRTLLGLQNGVGIKSCIKIAKIVLDNNLNFKGQFGLGRSKHLFQTRENNAIDKVLDIVNTISGWSLSDTMLQRIHDISDVISTHLSGAEADEWNRFARLIPSEVKLEELLSLLGARSETDFRQELIQVYQRLGQAIPAELDLTGCIRIMTLHSSKGLSAKVVFIPGLEEELLPGAHRAQFPGQVEESARLLYVGITRARANCILSFSKQRMVNGSVVYHKPSRFVSQIGVVFQTTNQGLQNEQIDQIISDCSNL